MQKPIETKLLTVIVPSYNMEAYLPKCLGSLVIEDVALRDRLDVIVVNDGSKDRTSEIAHSFEAEYPGVFRVIDKPNGHYGSCINAALPLAVGKYVRLLDADDYVLTDNFQRMLSCLAESEADVVISDMRMVNEKGESMAKSDPIPVETDVDLDVDRLCGIRFVSIHRGYYRTSLFDGNWYRQLEGIAYTDCQWCSIPMLRVKTFRYCPIEVTWYLIGREGQSLDAAVRARNFSQQLCVLKELGRVHSQGRPTDCRTGAWSYFEGLYVSEVCNAYSALLLGIGVHRLNRALLEDLDEFLASSDTSALKLVISNEIYGVIAFARGYCRFHFVRSYLRDPRFLSMMKIALCRLALAFRRWLHHT